MELRWDTEEWNAVEGMLPEGWEAQAKEKGALRRVRKVGSAGEFLRLVLLHAGGRLSLRQTVVRAAQWGIARMSDMALFKRLKTSGEWLRWICQMLVEEAEGKRNWAVPGEGLRMVAVDSTDIKEPGAKGASWRLHYGIEVPGVTSVFAELTDKHGGESLTRYRFRSGDLAAGDRNYCKEGQIRHAVESGAHVLLRWHSTGLPLLRAGDGQALDVAGWVKGEAAEGMAEAAVRTKGGLALRLCALPVAGEAAERERVRVREGARKQGRRASEASLELAGFIVLVTSLPREGYDLAAVMSLYRLRWQVELAFKRLKSLLGASHVPKRDPDSARAWLQAKMLVSLLMEKLLHEAEVLSPWGYLLPAKQPPLRVR
jgi:hypothetical protein